MSKETWFTSDLHLGHSQIIKHCSRPFADSREMDGHLIAQWNAVVQPDDHVWVVGDFAFRGMKSPGDYLERLTGRKHLIHGNHDSAECREHQAWASSQQMAEISVDGVRVVLLHYAMRTWPKAHHGSLHLYGHSHGALSGDRQSLDVGVDVWDFRPVQLADIQRRLATLPECGARRESVA